MQSKTQQMAIESQSPKNKLSVRRAAMIVAALLTVSLILDCATYSTLNPPDGRTFNTGDNGIWLRYLWYFGKKTDAEKEALIERLGENQIKYAFFHVRSTDTGGKLLFKHEDTGKRLTDLMHERLPEMKVIAWLYIPSNVGRDGVDLASETSRQNICDAAVWLTEKCGFDGVQLDYEFFPETDIMFPTLLHETRTAIGADKFLSVATPMWYPGVLWGWSENHFTEIADRCDQLAVMCYDSWLYHPKLYEWLVEQQAIRITAAVAKTPTLPGSRNKCKVLLGVPVYDTDKGTPAHMTWSENLRVALRGVKRGLASPDAVPAVFEGIAPFAEYTMDDEEWSQYRKWWLDK